MSNKGKTAYLSEDEYDEEVYDYLVERTVDQEEKEIINSFRKYASNDSYSDY